MWWIPAKEAYLQFFHIVKENFSTGIEIVINFLNEPRNFNYRIYS